MESYWPGLFAKALEGVNIKELITNIGSGVGKAPAAGILTFNFFITLIFLLYKISFKIDEIYLLFFFNIFLLYNI